MNEEEKKAIDFLKETNFDYLDYDMCVSSVETISNLVERLQKENEKLKVSDSSNSKIIANMSTRHFQDREKIRNSIPVQKIKDKIEELKQQDREWTEELSEPDSNFKNIDRNLKRIKNQIDDLQELLEK